MNMTFNGFCEGLYPNNQGGDTLFSLVRKLNELLPEMIEGIEEGGGGDSDINNLKLYYDTPSQSLQLQGVEGKVISEISAAPFIKDGMLNAVENNETEHIITLTFNTDAGKAPITLNYDSLWEGMETSLKGYTDSQVATLSSQVVKGIRLGSSTSNEPISDGVVTLPVASGVGDGVMSSEMYVYLNRTYITSIGPKRDDAGGSISYHIGALNPTNGAMVGNRLTIPVASSTASGIMTSTDKTKLDSIISTGDGTKFLADDFTYKTIQMPDLSTYATKSELSGYLPLSGGTMTGSVTFQDDVIFNGFTTIPSISFMESGGGYINGGESVTISTATIDGHKSVISMNPSNENRSQIVLQGEFIGMTVPPVIGGLNGDPLYYSGNFIAGTDYLAPGGVSIADVSGLQDSLDGKVNTTGDSYKNNNACWGGTRPNGTQTCLLYIDTNGNNKLGNCYGGTYLRASAPHTLFLEVGTPGSMDDSVFYSIYNEGNFKAGTNYVAPSTLNNYLPLSGGAMSGNITMNGANSSIYLRNSATITGYFGEDALPILYPDATTNRVVLGTVGKPLQVRSNNPIVRTNSGGTEYTVYDSGNLDVSEWYWGTVTTDYNSTSKSGLTNYRSNVTNNPGGSYGTVATFADLDAGAIGTNDTFGFQLGRGNDLDDTVKVRTFAGALIGSWSTIATQEWVGSNALTKADVLDTIIYTTSASEENLRAWNNYINGYIGNLQVVDNSAFDLTRQTSGVDKVNRKFEIIIMGGSPRKLILITYTLAEDGSLTKTQEDYTLTPATT